jgi:beta-1,4-mannosyl-glycoprotein beta-1,4-N-acetylglucosaminyltransferase
MTILEKNKKIIDCFIFYNEFEMLTYRLNILNPIVDYFIIVESTHTFSGIEKDLLFNENKQIFEQFKEKIIHVIVDDFPYKYPNINYDKKEQWENEFYQRNQISEGLKQISLDDNDLIIIADVDEIPDPNVIYKCKTGEMEVDCNSLEMDMYYYNLHTLHKNKWSLPKIVSYRKYKELNMTCDQIRNDHNKCTCSTIKNSGWHLSYFGNSEYIKNKIHTFSHQELNHEKFTNTSTIEDRIKNSSDLYGRKHVIINKLSIEDNPYLPPDYGIFLQSFL